MARMPYTNFHDINLDWIIKRVMKAFTPDNPPDYPVKSVNNKTGHVILDSDDIQDIDSGLDLTDALRKKQNRPESTGTAGQVLGLDNQLQPVWLNQPAPGVTAYDDLTGRPKINNVTLSGELDGTDLGLLDAPAAAGSLGQVLTSDGQGGQTWQTLPTPPQPLAGDYAPVIMDSASGPVASFPDGADDLDIVSLVAEIVPEQAGTGDPTPSNIRAISGRGGMSIYRRGKNLFNINDLWENGTIHTLGTEKTKRIAVPVPKNRTVICSTNVPNNTNPSVASITITNSSANVTPPSSTAGVFINSPRSVISSSDGFVYIGIRIESASYLAWNETTFAPYYIQLELGNTASDYEVFSGTDLLFAWGDTAGQVYGGTLDAISGVLTVTHGIVNISTLSWTYESNYTYPYFVGAMPASCAPGNSVADQLTLTCSHYKAVPNMGASVFRTSDYNLQCCLNAAVSTKRLLIQNNNYTSVDSFIDSLSDINVVYPLADSVTYQLTPQQVQTILGTNNIFSDSGNCSVTYRADTKLFILKVI